MSTLSVSEVIAAIWGKVARGDLDVAEAEILDRGFIADVDGGRFVLVPVSEAVIARSLDCVRRHSLRGADSLQLATALMSREADPSVTAMAVFDRRLRAAAEHEGLELLPPMLRV